MKKKIYIYICIFKIFYFNKKIMIIIPIKEGENIERALKKFKRKFERTGTVKELKNRQAFKRPSIVGREVRNKAIYVQRLRQEESEN